MKRHDRLILLLLCASLAACRPDSTTPPGTSPTTVQPTRTPPAVTEPDSNEPAATAAANTPSPLPASTLFDADWNDREPFRPGLLDNEQVILDQLPGASVYHLAITIEDSLTVASGRLEVHYTNTEAVALDRLYFHLFPNLLGGSIAISKAQVNGQSVAPAFTSFNDSVMQLPLAAPLAPGQAAVAAMDFLVAVPTESGRNYGVFAYVNDVLALAHAYPLIAVYDGDGWNVELPAEAGDVVYADTSFYLVRITAPADQVVVAGGVEIGRETTAATQSLTFAAGPMRDFYAAISDSYTGVSRRLGQTRINSYAPAELAEGAELALDHAAAALEAYGNRFGSYPFTELDVVTTATLALGIEYPGIIVNTMSMYDLEQASGGRANRTVLEATTAHEVAHQWFYSLIGNDQLDEPWLDESLTQYATLLYFRDIYGPAGGEGFYQSLEQRWQRVEEADIAIGLPVSAYDGVEYSAIVYGRGPIFVDTLAQTMGQATFDAFLRDYAATFRWGIATTAAFKELAESHCQCDLTPLFEEWVYDN